jgi:hypothetical protein
MSAIATAVAATVDQQNSAVAAIAEGVSRASGKARSGTDAMSKIAGVTTDSRSTDAYVKDLADAVEAENLVAEVRHFLSDVQAAQPILLPFPLHNEAQFTPCKACGDSRSQGDRQLGGAGVCAF